MIRTWFPLTLTVICLTAALCILPSKGIAEQPASEAQQVLNSGIKKVLQIIKDPAYQNGNNKEEMLARVDEIVQSLFDYSEFSARTVGRNWRSFTPDQRTRFEAAFSDLLRATYLERIDGYNGNGVQLLGERKSKKGDKIEVLTTLDLDGVSIPINYRMVRKSEWKVYDVIVEGVSLVKNYRTQFKEILLKESPDALIERVQERAMQMRKSLTQKQ